MRDYSEIESIIVTLSEAVEKMKRHHISQEELDNVNVICQEINKQLYHNSKLKFQKDHQFDNQIQYQLYIKELGILIRTWQLTIQRHKQNPLDEEFWDIYEFFKYVDEEVIYQKVLNHFLSLPEGLRIEFLSLPHRYTFLKGKIDFVKNDFSLIKIHTEMMAKLVEQYRWLYEHLADYRSKNILNGIIRYWCQFSINDLHRYTENVFSDYFDLDILSCGKEEVFVDLGAYTGDSILDYIRTFGGGISEDLCV